MNQFPPPPPFPYGQAPLPAVHQQVNVPVRREHICFSGSLECSGCNPCIPCVDQVRHNIIPFAMMHFLNHVNQTTGGMTFSQEQVQVFLDAYTQAWPMFYDAMAKGGIRGFEIADVSEIEREVLYLRQLIESGQVPPLPPQQPQYAQQAPVGYPGQFTQGGNAYPLNPQGMSPGSAGFQQGMPPIPPGYALTPEGLIPIPPSMMPNQMPQQGMMPQGMPPGFVQGPNGPVYIQPAAQSQGPIMQNLPAQPQFRAPPPAPTLNAANAQVPPGVFPPEPVMVAIPHPAPVVESAPQGGGAPSSPRAVSDAIAAERSKFDEERTKNLAAPPPPPPTPVQPLSPNEIAQAAYPAALNGKQAPTVLGNVMTVPKELEDHLK